MRICFLGTRNVDPTRRTSLGVVADLDGIFLLLDAGPYVVQGLAEIGITPDDIDAVFVSHDHADHCGGMPAFVMTWLLGSTTHPQSFQWAVPHGTLAMADYVRVAYPALVGGALPRQAVITREPLSLGTADVTWLKLDHAVETWGAHITDPSTTFAYLPDSSATGLESHSDVLRTVDNVAMSVIGSAKVLPEALRFKFPVAEQAGKLASAWGLRRLFVQHLVDPDDIPAVTAEIQQSFNGELIFPVAGEWIDLS